MEMHIKSSAKAQDYFDQGKQFLEAAWKCYGKENDTGFTIIEDGKFQQLSAPCIVNAAFSSEMFLKSILNRLGIEYDRNKEGHNLYLLYKKLPSNIQTIIAKFCGSKKDTTVFEDQIKKHAKDFVDIRYFVESNGWVEMSPVTIITIAENLSRITDYLLNNKNLEEIL